MTRLLALLFCLFFLAGCAQPVPPEEESIPSSQKLYAPGHTLETQSRGMLQVFPTGIPGDGSVSAVGNDLLLCDGSTLRLLTGKSLALGNSCPGGAVLLTTGDRIYQYIQSEKALWILDTGLNHLSDISLPEDSLGIPGVTPDGEVYFCTESAIYHRDADGFLRILRDRLDITDGKILCLNDALLFVTVTDSHGKTDCLFLRSDNGGEVFSDFPADTAAFFDGTLFWACTAPESREICVLTLEERSLQLNSGKGEEFFAFLPQLCSVITVLPASEAQPLTAKLYDLSSGLLRSTVELGGIRTLSGACITEQGILYLTAVPEAEDTCWLLRWNYDAFPPESDDCFLTVRYTEASPDREGISGTRTRAQRLSREYGVQIAVFEDAAAVQPWDYRFTPEYRVPQTNWALDAVAQVLSQFPEGFFQSLSGHCEGITIGLTAVMQGTAESGSLDFAQGLQFSENNRCFISLTTTGLIEYNLFHEFSHLIDTQVLSRSRAYDNWDTLNPSDFAYSFDFEKDMSRYSNLLTGDARCFVDTCAMYSPAEDRARILEYAANPGNGERFLSPVMQNKLQRICLGIREAFGLTNSSQSFVWEQYLTG